MNTEKLYQERLNQINIAFNHQEPDSVPIISQFETWAIGYSNKKTADVLNDNEEEFQCFKKVYEDMYFDAALIGFLTRDTRMYETLGNSPYFYSEDGVCVQHKECCYMNEDEYDALIADPVKYTVNTYYKKKYPSFNFDYPQSYEALKNSFGVFMHFIQKAASSAERYKRELGLPVLPSGIGVMPADLIMDYYRGLKNTLADVRRRPQKVAEAAEALFPMALGDITKGASSLPPFPYCLFPMHIPTYLNPKQFEKIYYPTFSRMIKTLHGMGANIGMVMEGNWEHLYDFINELPNNAVLGFLDNEDIFKAKEEIGETIAIAAGHSGSMLKYNSEQENIDFAKKLVDEVAHGGGFMLTLSTMLLAKDEIDPENLKAVNKFVHEYRRK